MGAAVDLVLRGGRVVTPHGIVDADVAIADGRIVGLSTGEVVVTARETIDVTGLTLLPGMIDTHVHLRQPGQEHKEDIEHATRAAAAGGYTTVIGMPNVNPVTSTVERFHEALALYERSAIVDYNHYPSGALVEEIPGLAAAGAIGFKVFMINDPGRDGPARPEGGVYAHGHLLEVAETIAGTGLPMLVHPHDGEILKVIQARFHARGERNHLAYAKAYAAYEGLIWDAPASLLVRLQAATGVHLHLLHMKTRRMIQIVREAKAAGQSVTAEVNPVCMLLSNDWANVERLGPYALSTYIGDGESEPLWEAFVDGTIDVIGTDHAPHTREEKEVGWTYMWKSPGSATTMSASAPSWMAPLRG